VARVSRAILSELGAADTAAATGRK